MHRLMETSLSELEAREVEVRYLQRSNQDTKVGLDDWAAKLAARFVVTLCLCVMGAPPACPVVRAQCTTALSLRSRTAVASRVPSVLCRTCLWWWVREEEVRRRELELGRLEATLVTRVAGVEETKALFGSHEKEFRALFLELKSSVTGESKVPWSLGGQALWPSSSSLPVPAFPPYGSARRPYS
jgi:hypothetical protein